MASKKSIKARRRSLLIVIESRLIPFLIQNRISRKRKISSERFKIGFPFSLCNHFVKVRRYYIAQSNALDNMMRLQRIPVVHHVNNVGLIKYGILLLRDTLSKRQENLIKKIYISVLTFRYSNCSYFFSNSIIIRRRTKYFT